MIELGERTDEESMVKKYIVDLSETEEQALKKTVKTGKHAAYKINHARILLKANINQENGACTDIEIASALDMSIPTIERVRKRFVKEGMESALNLRQGRGRKQRCLDGEGEAHLIALACSEPPTGKATWTLKMLANKMVELNYADSISSETVRKTLKKMNLSLGKKNAG